MEKENALKILRELHDKALFSERTALETFIPELAESEDERIRKEIYQFVYEQRPEDSWLAWLEKQDKSSDQIHYWTEEEIEPIISDYLRGAEHYGGMIGRLRCLKPKSLEKQGEQKPAWSEEDEVYLNTTIAYLKDAQEFKKTAENCIAWLKSLKQRIAP